MFNQLPCLGVEWNSSRCSMRRAFSGGKASYREAGVCVFRLSKTTGSAAHREMHVDQLLHGLGKILLGMSLGHLDMPPPQVGFQKHAEIADTSTLILAVPASRRPWLRRQRLTHLLQQLRGTFAEADPWPGRIARISRQVQHVLHPPDKLTAYTGET